MFNIEELLSIIDSLGGAASIEDIITDCAERRKMALFPVHRAELKSVLVANPKLAIFDADTNKWKRVAETEVRQGAQAKPSGLFLIEEYCRGINDDYMERCRQADALCKQFVNDFPVDSIASMSFDDYAIAKQGYGNPNSFCRRLRYELQIISSMGDARPNNFGVYYVKGLEKGMFTSLKKEFGDNYDAAFAFVKGEVVRTVRAAKITNNAEIANAQLFSNYKAKIISVYSPENYVPVCSKTTLSEYCSRVGVPYDIKEDMSYGMSRLSDWKYETTETSCWSNFIVMSFCDWLWRKNLTLVNK